MSACRSLDECERLRHWFEDLEQDRAQVLSERNALSGELEEARRQYDLLLVEVEHSKEESNRLETEIARLRDRPPGPSPEEVETLKAEGESLKAQVVTLKADSATLERPDRVPRSPGGDPQSRERDSQGPRRDLERRERASEGRERDAQSPNRDAQDPRRDSERRDHDSRRRDRDSGDRCSCVASRA